MKKLIKKIAPAWLLKWYRSRKMQASSSQSKPAKDVFTEIYNNNHWKSAESISGPGSELEQTKTLREELEKLLAEMKITSVLDIPCGDFKWMQKINWSKIHYTGADIVEELIKKNKAQHQDENNLKFIVLDLLKDKLPEADLIITRDFLVHLSYEDIFAALKNIKSSGCKYLLTTTFPDHSLNYDIKTGDWRTLNLQQQPFNFPKPILVINENCTEGNGKFKDKSMALWEVSQL